MNTEVIEPTLVILAGTGAYTILLGLLLGILVLNVLYLGLYIFVVVVIISNKKAYLICLSHSLAI